MAYLTSFLSLTDSGFLRVKGKPAIWSLFKRSSRS